MQRANRSSAASAVVVALLLALVAPAAAEVRAADPDAGSAGAGPGAPTGAEPADRYLAPAPPRPDPVLATGRSTSQRPGRAASDWIDTSDRSAVLAAYAAEFDRAEPALDWTGNVAGCQPGTTSPAHRQAVIQRINFYRAMAGVGDPVTLDNAMSVGNQQAALIMSANDDLSHYPPSGWACWTQSGYDSASQSNLALGGNGTEAIDWYMEDFGANNAQVGHRWWLLQPWAVRMGSGDVPAVSPTRSTNAVHVVDTANYAPGTGPMRDPDRIFTWPPSGYVPEALVWPRWSMHVDQATLATDLSDATVEVKVDGSVAPVTIDDQSSDQIVFVPEISGTGDRTVSVTVSGIERGGTTVSRSWTTTIMGASEYVPVAPCRVADSRGGPGLGPTSAVAVAVAGDGPDFAQQGGRPGGCGIPESATAVEASVTAVDPGASGFLRVWPAFEQAPQATFLNYTTGKGTTNTGAVPLGEGWLNLANLAGRTHVVVDVQGYFTASEPGARYSPMTPCRLTDTRVAGGALVPGVRRSYRITGSGPQFAAQGGKVNGCGIPAGADAIEASVSAVSPGRSEGFLRLWPTGGAAPSATFLNYVAGEGITNSGAIPLAGADSPHLDVRNYGGTTHKVVDVQGYFSTSGGGSHYVPITPCRIADTRSGGGAFVQNAQRSYRVTGTGSQFASQGGRANGCGIPAGASAVEASVTAVSPTRADGFVRAWPSGGAVPPATFLNYTMGQSTTNTGAVALATGGTSHLSLRNYGGASHYVIDVQGYYTPT